MTTLKEILKQIPMVGVGVGITKNPNVFKVMVEDYADINKVMEYLSNNDWTIHNVINRNLADESTFLISKSK
jgi:hypothetical protein